MIMKTLRKENYFSVLFFVLPFFRRNTK